MGHGAWGIGCEKPGGMGPVGEGPGAHDEVHADDQHEGRFGETLSMAGRRSGRTHSESLVVA